MAAKNQISDKILEVLRKHTLPMTRKEIEQSISRTGRLPSDTSVRDAIKGLKEKGLISVQTRGPIGIPEYCVTEMPQQDDDAPIDDQALAAWEPEETQEMPSDIEEAVAASAVPAAIDALVDAIRRDVERAITATPELRDEKPAIQDALGVAVRMMDAIDTKRAAVLYRLQHFVAQLEGAA